MITDPRGAGAVDPLDPVVRSEARVAAARRLVTAGLPPHSLDRLTQLAAELLQADYAQVSLIADEQVVASVSGLELSRKERASPAADSLCTLTVALGSALPIADTRADVRTAGLPPVTSGLVQAYLGTPLVDAQGLVVGSLCVYHGSKRSWSARDVGVLSVLAESVFAELELRALAADMTRNAAQLELALSAAEIGSFDYDLVAQRLDWDDRMLGLFGYDRESFGGDWEAFASRVHPDDRASVRVEVDRAVAARGDYAADYRIVAPGSGIRWIQSRGRVLADERGRPVRLLGAAYDVTELRGTRDRLARLLETMGEGFMSLDDQWRFSYVNPQAERMLGRRREELLGRRIWDEFPLVTGTAFQQQYELAVASREMVLFEEYFPPRDSWYEVRAWPTPDGLSVYFHDIAARRRSESERSAAVLGREQAYAAAEAANARLALLAEASTRLAESLEPAAVLGTLGELFVPQFGQWLAVTLVREAAAPLLAQAELADPDRLHVVHVVSHHPERRRDLQNLLEVVPLSVHDPVGMGAVARTGRPEWMPDVPDAALVARAPTPALLGAMRDLQVGSALSLPLISRGRALGALSLGEPVGGDVDLALLLDIASRAAVALDNALLYGAERRTGLTLQRSLLPRELPVVQGLSLASRYLPGATGAFVGGDWYQGVPVRDGILLAMGDVMGHGMRSAARMGQLRAIVATLALEGHGPGALLTRLAGSSDVLLDLDLATLLVAHYDVAGRRMTVASAGHPPPVLAPISGEPRFVDVPPGPPIGTVHGVYEEVSVDVGAGSTLVFYTDGLVENRKEGLDEGLERLRSCLREIRLPPEAVCDHVLEQLSRQEGGDDDVALLVMSAT